MKLKIIDSFCTGVVHKKFNAAFLSMLTNLNYKIEYKSSISSYKELCPLIEDEKKKRIIFSSLYVWEGESRWDVLFRYIIGVFQNVMCLIKTKNDEILVYNFNNPFSLYFLNTLNRFLKRNVFVLCHGEMEHLIPSIGSGGLLYKLIGYFVRSFFLKENRKVSLNFIVLSQCVLNNITKILPSNFSNHFSMIELPYIYEKRIINNNNKREKDYISIGTVGTFNENRGGKDFISLITRLKDFEKLKISVTGNVLWGINKLRQYGVDLPSNGGVGMIQTNEFDKRIANLDYILYLYPSTSYKLIASAAVMDAIDYKRPIIAIRNDYFEYMFQTYGEFGILVDDLEEMINVIKKIVEGDYSPNIDFDFIQRKSSPEEISKQFDSILKNN